MPLSDNFQDIRDNGADPLRLRSLPTGNRRAAQAAPGGPSRSLLAPEPPADRPYDRAGRPGPGGPAGPASAPAAEQVVFRLLGPLEVVHHGRALPLGGVIQRTTLGFLLLHANRVVSTNQLLKAMWPQEAPPTARKMLQNAVSGLRGLLARARVDPRAAELVSRAPGYMLRIDADHIDLAHFQSLLQDGRAALVSGSPGDAARLLRTALDCWRGPVLEDLAETGIDWPELAALRNSRMAALEDYFEAELDSGRHHEVMAELEAEVALAAPRERLCRLLMLALYRCGRHVEALGVYRRLRPRLLDEFGLEPGPELQDLYRAILRHDPSLDLPTAPAGPAARAPRRSVPAGRPVTPYCTEPGRAPLRSTVVPPRGAVPQQGAVPPPQGIGRPQAAALRSPDRVAELELLRSLLTLVRRKRKPHVVTILGNRDTGKSGLVTDFGDSLRQDGVATLWSADSVARPREQASGGLHSALERAAAGQPLVVVLEDLHRGDDPVLASLGDAVHTPGPLSLLVIVTARPELAGPELAIRRPGPDDTAPSSTTITLEPLSAA
ncbi:BTAD domain-containing putative transcriptional regulator [Kitasatospora sp. NPDC056181]|uniref:AfsR/SARP family transcriptional regulator n=1 Tax=Kitasatospora sp. NPDC056181 TaxID=3345737 RepID=UPI0035E222A8